MKNQVGCLQVSLHRQVRFSRRPLRQVHHGFRSEGRARNANTTLPSRKQCSLVDDNRPKTQFQAGTRSVCKKPGNLYRCFRNESKATEVQERPPGAEKGPSESSEGPFLCKYHDLLTEQIDRFKQADPAAGFPLVRDHSNHCDSREAGQQHSERQASELSVLIQVWPE